MARAAATLLAVLGAGTVQAQNGAPPLPGSVTVTGADGVVNIVNGRYTVDPTEIHNQRPCYKKDRFDLWLCADVNNLWNFQTKGLQGSSRGLMVSTQKHAESPVGAGPWRVWSQTLGGSQDGVWAATATVVDEGKELTQEERRYRTGEMPIELMVDRTIAGLLLGFAVLAAVVMGLVGSYDEHLRAYTYRMVSSAFSFLIALMVTQGLWDVFVHYFLPESAPRGLGIKPSLPIKVLLGLFFWIICLVALHVVGWKVQNRRTRVMAIKSLGGNIFAMVGVALFTHMQQAAVFHLSFAFSEGTGATTASSNPDATLHHGFFRAICAFGTVAFAFGIFGLFRQAAAAARRDYFLYPPTSPWGEPLEYRISQPPGERSCMPTFGGRTAPQPVGEWNSSSWAVAVDEAEDEGAIVATGFLLSQAIMFCRTGELPTFREHYTNVDNEAHLLFFGNSILALTLLFLVVLAVRANVANSGGRWGKTAQCAIGVAITFMGYRASCWNTRSMFTNRPLSLMVSAIAITLGSFFLMIVTDKILDLALNRESSPFKNLHAALGTTSLSEDAMRGVNSCFGLVMALAWELNFQSAVETVVQSHELLINNGTLAEPLICLTIAILLTVSWRRSILPKSEMKEALFAEEIMFEQQQFQRREDFLC